MVKFKKVTATYKNNIGIFNINFEVEPGQMIFVMGPTGAGKTTILKALYKDIQINSGQIFLDKEDITSCSIKKTSLIRRQIGMIFQDFKLLNDRTVFENIALPLRIEGENYLDIKKKVKLVLVGCVSLILMQTMIHIGVNIRLFPTTGMTLPFISYGGSSIISISVLSGIILNLTKRKIY